MPTTAVSSPRGHDSWWSRRITQARMNGATAAASSSQAQDREGVPRGHGALARRRGCALRLSGLVPYHGSTSARASSRPPCTASSSPRPRRLRFIRAEPIGCGRVNDALSEGPDGRLRCWWGASSPEYVAYHDDEWGRPGAVRQDALYEKLMPGGVPVGAVVDHDPAQARGLPGGVRRVRPRARWRTSATTTWRG